VEIVNLSHSCLRRLVDAIDSDVRCRPQALLAVIDDTSEEVVLRILAHFSQSLREAAKAVSLGIEGGDFDLAWRACHKIAGTAELLGFEKLGIDSRHLSVLVKEGSVKSPDVVDRLAQYAAVCLEYRELIVRNCENWEQYL